MNGDFASPFTRFCKISPERLKKPEKPGPLWAGLQAYPSNQGPLQLRRQPGKGLDTQPLPPDALVKTGPLEDPPQGVLVQLGPEGGGEAV